MKLLLVRHAEAAAGSPDELRPLTSTGREQARSLGAQLRDAGFEADALLTSPLLRARETGELIGRELDLPPQTDERLAPGADAEGITSVVRDHGDTVIVVAHQPDCSRVAAALTGDVEPGFPPAGSMAIRLGRASHER